jgi:SAM-dependent methyltransferase
MQRPTNPRRLIQENPVDDPVQRHPTRSEQLDILATLIADTVSDDEAVLELGCGVGYVAHLILEKRSGVSIVGVDRNPDALRQARTNLEGSAFTAVEGDLEKIDAIAIPEQRYGAIYTALTFHDLPDTAKQAVIKFAAGQLTPGGYFLLYDRIRLTDSTLFPLQQGIWSRIERVHGKGMRTADSFDAYQEDLGTDNRPASLADYLTWFPAAGLTPQILHLHGNVVLVGGARQ